MNERFNDIMKLARIELIIIPIFILFKYIRPKVLESASPEFLKITLLSIPNFFEAIVGTLTLTGVFLFINDRMNIKRQISLKIIYILAVIAAAIYVITQELNIINIRTNKTFDQNDIFFSIVGLIIGYTIILLVKPSIRLNSEKNS
ncbi:hypothetical protein [Aquimarina sp. 2201CG14-23]|uniref:hypothetical protein n=1 Tax=Aquimarina mycalae TaxID=3040073 RepID=UPI002477F7C2|nr:hypothetical protein [Aquimarina sp. 2201CG14-23]MDH7445986.1 hypothetical protein [Aquimarina sp. 2201CG14-23]